jgi:ABC-2 type transport system ATP-binding protein
MTAIVVEDLRKSYGAIHAVDGVTFSVEEGECVALLGPNGAGKTTTLEVLEGYLERDSGTVAVLGVDPYTADRRWREQVGIVLQGTAVDPYLTARESLARTADFYPDPMAVGEVLEVVGLTEKADAKVKQMSGGQRRRLDVAFGIIGRPHLLFLDEPTTGFDPSARRGAWELVDNLRALGTTIMLTTHYMDEAQALADRIVIVGSGRVVAQGTPDDLGGRDTAALHVRFRLPDGIDPAALPVPVTRDNRGAYELSTTDDLRVLHDLTGWALEHGVALEGLVASRPSLEDTYLSLIGQAAADSPQPADATPETTGASR